MEIYSTTQSFIEDSAFKIKVYVSIPFLPALTRAQPIPFTCRHSANPIHSLPAVAMATAGKIRNVLPFEYWSNIPLHSDIHGTAHP